MTSYRPNRNLVRRLSDGKLVNVARFRGNLFICADACCCGRDDLGNAPVPNAVYQREWHDRRLRNFVHLTIGGCLGPCALANVALLLIDGQALWFHSMDDEAAVVDLFDHIEAVLLGAQPGEGLTPGLAERAFTASTWQPRRDGAPLDDHRTWRGRDHRPDATPACELPPEAFLHQADVAGTAEELQAEAPSVLAAIAAMDGPAALPRANGELVFAEPWQGRAFGMAVALHESGAFTWDTFRDHLVARIAEAERRPEPFEYYRCWLAALEDTLAGTGLASSLDLTERTYEFEFGERQDIY